MLSSKFDEARDRLYFLDKRFKIRNPSYWVHGLQVLRSGVFWQLEESRNFEIVLRARQKEQKSRSWVITYESYE